jgi:prepilin-type N-terminal cleavage/methylation domain-containing protein
MKLEACNKIKKDTNTCYVLRVAGYTKKGFTLIETLIASALFLIIAVGLYQAYITLFKVIDSSRVNLVASSLATEQFEIIRNMPYAKVGVVNSIPSGLVPHIQTLVRDGITFTVTTTVRNIDDPFDGVLGGTPNDISPADYKLVETKITCLACRNFSSAIFTTRVSPKNLEMASTNGALFIRVFDANGVPVQAADVRVENNQITPHIRIDDVTDANGVLQLVDIPPGAGAYEVFVSKEGYSSDQTYGGTVSNPNPTKPFATVAQQQVTQISFSIDLLSSLSVQSVTQTCTVVPGVSVGVRGSKLIGTSPDVNKYYQTHTTNYIGEKVINDLEWDTYTLSVNDGTHQLLGLIPLLPPIIAPNSNLDVRVVVGPADPNTLLVTVKDSGTGLPISEADVEISGGETQTTGRGFLRQTDWSGGSGEGLWSGGSNYSSRDAGIETSAPAGVLTLVRFAGAYTPSGNLTSSIFDVASPSNFYRIAWQSEDQPPLAGPNAVRLQVATSNDAATTTWSFLGPDGTASTYYTLADQNINSIHNANRYFRYKVFLATDDVSVAPTISDISFTFTSECVPPGQVTFSGLSDGVYVVSVSKAGYQSYTSTPLSVISDFVSYEATLIPE